MSCGTNFDQLYDHYLFFLSDNYAQSYELFVLVPPSTSLLDLESCKMLTSNFDLELYQVHARSQTWPQVASRPWYWFVVKWLWKFNFFCLTFAPDLAA